MNKKIQMKIKKIKEAFKKMNKKIRGKERKKEERTKKEKIKREIRDWGISIAAALLIYYVILPAALGTSTPMIVVSSCSQQPYLNIGNVIVLRGTDMQDIEAPTITIDGKLNYTYNEETDTLTINNQDITKNSENDIVTYVSHPTGTQIIHRALAKLEFTEEADFAQGETILLTQGDANPMPDQITQKELEGERALCLGYSRGETILLPQDSQELVSTREQACLSTLVTEDMLVGRKTGWRIPILGHIKLFFCDVVPFCDGHSNPGTNYEYKLTC